MAVLRTAPARSGSSQYSVVPSLDCRFSASRYSPSTTSTPRHALSPIEKHCPKSNTGSPRGRLKPVPIDVSHPPAGGRGNGRRVAGAERAAGIKPRDHARVRYSRRAGLSHSTAGGAFCRGDGCWRRAGNHEFRILTDTAPPEYGGTAGATTAVVTRSGGNGVHGSLYEFLRNDKLDTRNFFSPSVEPLKQNQYGGTVGGPLKRDKLFYFVYYEGYRNRQGESTASIVPSDMRLNQTPPSALGFGYPSSNMPGQGPPFFNVTGYSPIGGAITGPRNSVQDSYELQEGLSWAKGRHSLKFGGEGLDTRISMFQGIAPNAFFVFASTFPTNNAIANLLVGAPVVFYQGLGNFNRGLRDWGVGLYAQDEWRLTPRLTLNYGLRYKPSIRSRRWITG
jgi:hypothetical protein